MMIGNAEYQCSCVRYIQQDHKVAIISVPVAVGLLLIIIGIIAIFLHHRRQRKLAQQAEMSTYYMTAMCSNDEHDYSSLSGNGDNDYSEILPENEGNDYSRRLSGNEDSV